jgi:hypothetical protein
VRIVGKCHRLLCVRHARRQQHAQLYPPQSMRLPVDHRIGLTYHVTRIAITVPVAPRPNRPQPRTAHVTVITSLAPVKLKC